MYFSTRFNKLLATKDCAADNIYKKLFRTRRFIIIAGCIVFLTACNKPEQSENTARKSLFTVDVPPVILDANLSQACNETLFATLTIDSERNVAMTIVSASAVVEVNNVTEGEHEFSVTWSCYIDTRQLDLASSNSVTQVTQNQQGSSLVDKPNHLEFNPDNLTFPDTDLDNVSNLRELELAENPFTLTAPKIPTIAITTLGQSILFSWDNADEYTSYYNVLAYPDGGEGYTTLGSNISEPQIEVPFSGYQMLITEYVLQACNAACTDSVKTKIPAGMLNQMAYIKAFNSQEGDRFGFTVALSADGNTLAVGAPWEDGGIDGVYLPPNSDNVNAAADAGAVYIYSRVDGQWMEQAYIKAFNSRAGDLFGTALALNADGTTLAVGAKNADIDLSGSAYVYTFQNGKWNHEGYLKAFNSQLGDLFGFSVALSADGNILAVGANYEGGAANGVHLPADADTANAVPDSGAVYTYTRQNGIWTGDAYIKSFNSDFSDHFGTSIALSADGKLLAVGANREAGSATGVHLPTEADTTNPYPSAGAVYTYTRQNNTWIEEAYIKAFNTQNEDLFGHRLALSADGNTLVVAALQEDGAVSGAHFAAGADKADGAKEAGAVYVYTRADGSSNWNSTAYIKAFNSQPFDAFGYALALSPDGDTLAVGARFEDGDLSGARLPIYNDTVNAAPDAGAVYIYTRQNAQWKDKAYIKATNTDAYDSFGQSVALSNNAYTLAIGADVEGGAAPGVQSMSNADTTNAAPSAGAVYIH